MSKTGQLYFDIQQKITDFHLNEYDPECNYCVVNFMKFAPSHYANKNCKSGKHNHCTCDVCF